MEGFVKAWEHADSPVLWVEAIFVADTEKMPVYFGFSYGGHHFVSENQTTTFYINIKSEEAAKRKGLEKYNDAEFVEIFVEKSQKAEARLKEIIKEILGSDLANKTNDELLSLFRRFFDSYASLMGFYRFCRAEFYELLMEQLQEKFSLSERDVSLFLNNDFGKLSVKVSEDAKRIASGLKKVGGQRFQMHETWMNAFTEASYLLEEISKRIGLKLIEVQNCTSKEIADALAFNKKPPAKEIKQRMKYFRFSYKGNSFEISLKGKKQGAGKEELAEFRGQPVSAGHAIGRVSIITESLGGALHKDLERLPAGNILVTNMTSPDMVIAMKKAAAIVTNEGGLLCHAAIVSRELGKPCIVGTKVATKALSNGDLVEVDANKGIVRVLEKSGSE